MKRQYGREEYLRLAAALREAIPSIALSTDVIVGFPGESEADFGQTLSLLSEIRFASVFGFTYSPRPGTAAARWTHDVSSVLASERLARLFDLQQGIQREINGQLEGRTLEVLVDGEDRKGLRSSGRSPCNRVVNIEGAERFRPGTFIDIRVLRGFPNSLLGAAA